MKKFQYITWGCRIIVVTDHHALCWLLSKKELAGRLARWATVVQGENLNNIHKSGKAHLDADAFSRYPVPGGEEEIDEFNENFVPFCNIQTHQFDLVYAEPQLPNAQQQDTTFSEIYRMLSLNEEKPTKYTKTNIIQDKVLYRRHITPDGFKLRVCVPAKL